MMICNIGTTSSLKRMQDMAEIWSGPHAWLGLIDLSSGLLISMWFIVKKGMSGWGNSTQSRMVALDIPVKGSSVVALDCHCNQLVGRHNNIPGNDGVTADRNSQPYGDHFIFKLTSDGSFLQKMNGWFYQLKY